MSAPKLPVERVIRVTRPCEKCKRPIGFALVSNREGRPPSRMPLDPQPDPAGNVAVYRDGSGTLVGRVLGKDGRPLGYERLMMPHFATCPVLLAGQAAKQAAHDDTRSMPEGVVSLSEWKRRGRDPVEPSALCPICHETHPRCRFRAGSLHCVSDPCGNPHHKGGR